MKNFYKGYLLHMEEFDSLSKVQSKQQTFWVQFLL